MMGLADDTPSLVYAPRYDLIPPEALEALARTFGEGAEKHGAWDWKLPGEPGARRMYSQELNHALIHILDWRQRRNPVDLIHAVADLIIIYVDERDGRRDLDDLQEGAAPPEDLVENRLWCFVCRSYNCTAPVTWTFPAAEIEQR